MGSISEKVELLGKGLYTAIPDVLTLTNIPTASELEYVSSEDFDETLLKSILPKAVEEKIDFNQLLEIDFQWVVRCMRILNYGPYHTTNLLAGKIFCGKCGRRSDGEYRVNLNSIDVKPLPDGFVNDIVISKEEFIDYNGDIHVKLPTIQQIMNARKDKTFQQPNGEQNMELARICYMITSMKGKSGFTPIEVKMKILNELSAADYLILRQVVSDLTDYGLRAGGHCTCPKCGDSNAAFLALVDDRFFRPSLGDLREWKNDRREGKDKDVS